MFLLLNRKVERGTSAEKQGRLDSACGGVGKRRLVRLWDGARRKGKRRQGGGQDLSDVEEVAGAQDDEPGGKDVEAALAAAPAAKRARISLPEYKDYAPYL